MGGASTRKRVNSAPLAMAEPCAMAPCAALPPVNSRSTAWGRMRQEGGRQRERVRHTDA